MYGVSSTVRLTEIGHCKLNTPNDKISRDCAVRFRVFKMFSSPLSNSQAYDFIKHSVVIQVDILLLKQNKGGGRGVGSWSPDTDTQQSD